MSELKTIQILNSEFLKPKNFLSLKTIMVVVVKRVNNNSSYTALNIVE